MTRLGVDIDLHHDGIRLAATVLHPAGARDGDGRPGALGSTRAKAPVLMLHGLTHARDTWAEAAAALAQAGHTVWLLDFHGHGHSARAPGRYPLPHNIADARCALAAITAHGGRPALLVGHSLGAMVAGALAQQADAPVCAALLEDPPWYFGDRAEFNRSIYPPRFALTRQLQARFLAEARPLADWHGAIAGAPDPLLGGCTADHVGARQLWSNASALQRFDPEAWRPLLDSGDVFDGFDPDAPFHRPVRVLQADPAIGAALGEGHAQRLAAAHPQAEIARYDRGGHTLHRMLAHEARFRADLLDFTARRGG